MKISNTSFEFAVRHVEKHGDTDIFPFPIENRIFADKSAEIVLLLTKIDKDYHSYFSKIAPEHCRALSGVGYTGFRWATQLDPLWGLYLLALVKEIGSMVEDVRVPEDKNVVFSYRLDTTAENERLFKNTVGWKEFRAHARATATLSPYVLVCDISDFYSRIYHHRLENALLHATKAAKGSDSEHLVKRIMSFLQHFANNNSYGLPVGGNASRLLAELLLNRTDRLFLVDGIKFCRFADDYCVFAESEEMAFQALVKMSESLLRNEGLSLQKAKTRILQSKDFIAEHPEFEEENASSDEKEIRRFMRLSLHFDPYSETAVEDYDELKEELESFDIQRLLTRELAKSRIHGPVAKKLVSVIQVLPPNMRDQAIQTFLENIHTLSPIFSTLTILLKKVFPDVPIFLQKEIVAKMVALTSENSYITQIEVNLLFAIRLIAEIHSEENEALLNRLYLMSASQLVRREIILAMAKWNALYWISDLKTKFSTLGVWEKRSFIIASYFMEDEGDHWRSKAKKGFSEFENICSSWAEEKFKAGVLRELI